MLARGLRFTLTLLFLAGTIGGSWGAAGRGLPAWTPAVIAAWVVCGVPALVVLLSFGLAHRSRSVPPTEYRIGLLRGLACVVREILVFAAVFLVIQPFPRVFIGRDPAKKAALPVLLVPGFMCNAGLWAWFARALRARGHVVYTVTLEPVFGDIDDLVAPLARRVEEVLDTAGAGRLALVAHSMGGLVARAYLRGSGRGKVARLITIGSPHHGSALAPLGHGANARAMVPAGPWLNELTASEHAGLGVTVTSIFSYQDNLVAPQESSILAGAKNVPLAGIGHMSLVWSARVAGLVSMELETAAGPEGTGT